MPAAMPLNSHVPAARRIGMSTGALFPDYHTEDAIEVAAAHGFGTVELYLQTHGEYQPACVTDIKHRLRDHGLSVHSLHNDIRHFDLWSSYRRRAAESYALFERLIAVAAELSARAITWHGFRDHLDVPAAFDRFADTVRVLGEQARQAGVTLTIENVSWCYLRRVEHIQRVRLYDLPLGFTFDPFQAVEAGQNPVDIIEAMNGHLTTVHLSDYGPGEIRHLPLGDGVIDWLAVFGALVAVDYRGPLIIEVPYRGDLNTLTAGRVFVERCLAAV
ncbi:MAG: sugar phosphate isomerase/epimerase [Anaerolineae bacterium]|nr:sugar phosphate isomerase/epimerase [Anaerolineae bacterium]